MNTELILWVPAAAVRAWHASGWVQQDIQYVKPSKDGPIILVLDGVCLHIGNLDVTNMVGVTTYV